MRSGNDAAYMIANSLAHSRSRLALSTRDININPIDLL